MKRAIPAALAVLGASLISGCLVAGRPLITPDNADYPFGEMVLYRLTPSRGAAANGSLLLYEQHYVRTDGDGRYFYVLFKALGDGYYVAQQIALEAEAPFPYRYDLVRIGDGFAESFQLRCSDVAVASFLEAGAITSISRDPSGVMNCAVSDLDGLMEIARSRIGAKQPAGRFELR